MNKKLLLIGGGGHCKSVIDSLIPLNRYAEIGIIDKKEAIGEEILEVPVIGSDDDLSMFYEQNDYDAFVSVGSVGDPRVRVRLFALVERIGFNIPNIIDASAIVSEHVRMEKGIYIGKHAVVNAGVSIGRGTIVNTASVIEHECKIGQFVHLATGAVLCGGVCIGEQTHIGANSTVKQQIEIGANTIIGMGSVVLSDFADSIIAYGNPCKEIKKK
jgi:sugar O-acyltransferase (sialic acid O-acetyltransferase NeuD family)